MMIKSAKTLSPEWIKNYFRPSMLAAPGYKIDHQSVELKLDQNECPWDWPDDLKQTVIQELASMDWNRYAPAFTPEVTTYLANYAGVDEDMILTSNGSDLLISLILNATASHIAGKIVIAQPCFPLYEAHCRYYDFLYEPWPLDENFAYDVSRLPKLPAYSMVLFASPNNPTGTSLARSTLAQLLSDHPTSLFVADEAYFEFSDEPFTELLAQHSNLIIVRTFSKTLAAAGIRIGYAIAAPEIIEQIKKIRHPYLLNHFSIAAIRALRSYPRLAEFTNKTVTMVQAERQRLFAGLSQIAGTKFRIFPSQANFLLLQWPSQEACAAAYQKLIAAGILVRNISGGPKLGGCLRLTIGRPEDNNRVLQVDW